MTITQNYSTGTIAWARWSSVAFCANDFDFKGWKTAKPIHLTRYWSGEAAPVGRHAEARAIWSEEALHILYDCHQQEPLIVAAHPRTNRKAIRLWERDVCEAFIAPDPIVPNHYFEFEAAPTGEWLDVGIRLTKGMRRSDWLFKSGVAVAAKEGIGRILISLRIPWSKQIPKPRSGAKWRANFFRCVGSGEERGYLAWQPTLTEEPNFHVPEVFGWLQFD